MPDADAVEGDEDGVEEKAEEGWEELDDEEDTLDEEDEHGQYGDNDVPVRYAGKKGERG